MPRSKGGVSALRERACGRRRVEEIPRYRETLLDPVYSLAPAPGPFSARPGGRALQTFQCSVGSTSVFEAEPEHALAARQAIG
jgi:hypothetical protein